MALTAMPLVALMGAPLPTLAGTAARFGPSADHASLLFALLPIVFLVTLLSGGPLAEELGWRGFAQTLLQEHLRPLTAGLVVGVG